MRAIVSIAIRTASSIIASGSDGILAAIQSCGAVLETHHPATAGGTA